MRALAKQDVLRHGAGFPQGGQAIVTQQSEQILDQVIAAANVLPVERMVEASCWALIDWIAQQNERLNAEDKATLIGVAAVLYRQGEEEFLAGVTAGDFFAKLKGRGHDGN